MVTLQAQNALQAGNHNQFSKKKKGQRSRSMQLGQKNSKNGVFLHGIYIMIFAFDNTEETDVQRRF